MSTVITDNLTGKTSAGDVTITAGSATMQLQQGLAKAWNTIDGTGTVASRYSFNSSSTTDHSLGNYSTNITNVMSDAYHAGAGSSGFAESSGYTYIVVFPETTSRIRSNSAKDGAGEKDVDPVVHHTFGELA